MQFLDLTLPEPEANLALDEAILLQSEAAPLPLEVLRVWQPKSPFVVVGRASKIEQEVNLVYCAENNIPVRRRASGGAAIVTGLGCLMYAVVMSYQLRPHLKMLDQAHQEVMGNLQQALDPLLPEIKFQGTCDLTWKDKKFSGNALRCKKNSMIYHGTIMLEMDLQLISKCLKYPPRTPDYRKQRAHHEFVTNIPVKPDQVIKQLRTCFDASENFENWPQPLMEELVVQKYLQDSWNLQK